MRPILLQFSLPVVGEVAFPAYFTLLTLGFTAALLLTSRDAKRLGINVDRIVDLNLWMVVWGMIGSRILHVIADGHFWDYVHLCTNPKQVPAFDALVEHCQNAAQCGLGYLCDTATARCYPPQDCLATLKLWRGGFAYYGGLIAAVAFGIYYIRKHKLGLWQTTDLAAPGIALGLVLGRIGCFLNGCCYGKVTDSWIGVRFPRGSLAWRAQVDAGLISRMQEPLPVHPTQLYEAFGCLAIFLVLYWVVRQRQKRNGQVTAWMLVLYAVVRSVTEIWRDDERGVLFGWLSTSQIISIPLFVLGIYLLWLRRAGATGSDLKAQQVHPTLD